MTNALKTAAFLLPRPDIDLAKWSVIACDQFTAQPEYWRAVEAVVGDAPSSLRVTLPEAWLDESAARIPTIRATMDAYLRTGVWQTAVRDGFILTERTTSSGVRPGLMVCLDLDQYDFNPGARTLIRPTEGTVISRVPPRARIRAGAPVELPHVMMLIDDPGMTVIEPLRARAETLRALYDFELMQGGGHLRGWAVEGADVGRVNAAVDALNAKADGLLYAVGDGNHSLAAAKQCWLDLQKTLSPAKRENHPARYALVELINLNCPTLIFEPIHRLLTGVDPAALIADYRAFLKANGADEGPGDDLVAFDMTREWHIRSTPHPLRLLQGFLDVYLDDHPGARIDYIHGESALRKLVNRPDAMGFIPRALGKSELFPYIRRWGVLPRKTFSMGGASEKRYYLEARRIDVAPNAAFPVAQPTIHVV